MIVLIFWNLKSLDEIIGCTSESWLILTQNSSVLKLVHRADQCEPVKRGGRRGRTYDFSRLRNELPHKIWKENWSGNTAIYASGYLYPHVTTANAIHAS